MLPVDGKLIYTKVSEKNTLNFNVESMIACSICTLVPGVTLENYSNLRNSALKLQVTFMFISLIAVVFLLLVSWHENWAIIMINWGILFVVSGEFFAVGS